MNPTARKTLATVWILAAVALVAAAPALALAPKEARDQLDLLVTIDPSLRVVEVNVDASGFNGPCPPSRQWRTSGPTTAPPGASPSTCAAG